MRYRNRLLVGVVLVLGLGFSMSLFGQAEEIIEKTFPKKDEVKFKLALGEANITKSTDDKIHVRLEYTYDKDRFEAKFIEKEKSLILEEKFHGNGHNNHGGEGIWNVSIPGGVEIEFNSGTGGLTLEGVDVEVDGNSGTGSIEVRDAKGEFKLNSGTGDVEAAGSTGDFDLNSGTGNVVVMECKGDFEGNSGTGDVEASDITIETTANFNSGTGDAEVVSPNGADYDLTVSSGTGDALLDFSGKPLQGRFEFTCHARRGRIVCPEKFDSEEKYEEGDQTYLKKTFTRGKDSPQYFISTGTGKAELKK
jgi:hypothetical protein